MARDRCWTCRSVEHLSMKCPTKDDKAVSTQVGASRGQQEDAKSDRGAVCPSEDMNEVPLGARRQHASPHASSEPTRIKRLQKQLDESRRIEVERPDTGQATMGLPDSCATHALRPVPSPSRQTRRRSSRWASWLGMVGRSCGQPSHERPTPYHGCAEDAPWWIGSWFWS